MKREMRGWAAIDLVVVMLVGGLLLALGAPALQQAREKARAANCKDRLAAIAQGVLEFHDAKLRLPPGTLGYRNPPEVVGEKRFAGAAIRVHVPLTMPELKSVQSECQNLSALFLVLPYMPEPEGDTIDLDRLYLPVDDRLIDLDRHLTQIVADSDPARRVFESMLSYGPGAGATWPAGTPIHGLCTDPDGLGEVVSVEVSAFRCPSDTLDDDSGMPSIVITMPYWNGTSFFGTPLDGIACITANDKKLASTNFVAVAGTTSCHNVSSPLVKWAGAMTGRALVTLESVGELDGASMTFMFGESLGDVGRIRLVGEDGLLTFGDEKKVQPGQRFITRSWTWGGLATLSSATFPWAYMQSPDFMDPTNEGKFLMLLGDARLADPETFSSAHEDGVHFALCDGSVHTVPRSMRWQLYYGCGGLRDGTIERGF